MEATAEPNTSGAQPTKTAPDGIGDTVSIFAAGSTTVVLRATSSHTGEVQRLVVLGAQIIRDEGEKAMLIDPKGNESCVE